MSETKPVRCQKCGKQIGYVTVLVQGLNGNSAPLKNVKISSYLHGLRAKEKVALHHV
jgi:hypothetical protein